jgi:hypothetical protein
MSSKRKIYPDNSAILAQKTRGRSERAAISFAEKLDALDAMRKRVAPIVRSRTMRKNAAGA